MPIRRWVVYSILLAVFHLRLPGRPMIRRKTISLLTIAAILTALAGMTVAARERLKSDSATPAAQAVTLVAAEEGAVRGEIECCHSRRAISLTNGNFAKYHHCAFWDALDLK